MELFDDDGYPTEEVLQHIEDWDYKKGFKDLFYLVKQLWRYPDYFREVIRKDGSSVFILSTGGWSGNESVIGALNKNRMLWACCFHLQIRGGHWQYRVKR